MIPTFPNFKNIEWNDRTEVEKFTSQFPPYSDFNFVSMWSWNTREKMQLSQLHGNLILLFYDYITEKPFLSFMGKNDLVDTVHRLIDYSMLYYESNVLKLIPEAVALNLPDDLFTILPDEASHDYIMSATYLSTLSDTSLSRTTHPAAYLCQKFLRFYPHHSVKIRRAHEIVADEYLDMFKRWAKIKSLDHFELNEYSAFERFIHNKGHDSSYISLHFGDTMIAFATYEILSPDFAISHFAKADKNYSGIYDALNFTLGKALRESNIEYWNFEQDLGIPGLQQSKRKYKPIFYLKKFIIQKKN